MLKSKANRRKKKLDAISTKIAEFLVLDLQFLRCDVSAAEKEATDMLTQAIGLLDQAADLLVKSDEAQPA